MFLEVLCYRNVLRIEGHCPRIASFSNCSDFRFYAFGSVESADWNCHVSRLNMWRNWMQRDRKMNVESRRVRAIQNTSCWMHRWWVMTLWLMHWEWMKEHWSNRLMMGKRVKSGWCLCWWSIPCSYSLPPCSWSIKDDSTAFGFCCCPWLWSPCYVHCVVSGSLGIWSITRSTCVVTRAVAVEMRSARRWLRKSWAFHSRKSVELKALCTLPPHPYRRCCEMTWHGESGWTLSKLVSHCLLGCFACFVIGFFEQSLHWNCECVYSWFVLCSDP